MVAQDPGSLSRVVAANVRAHRAARRMRQVDLAEKVGMARATLASLEAERRRVSLEDAVALCEALDIPLADLLAGQDPAAVEARRALGV